MVYIYNNVYIYYTYTWYSKHVFTQLYVYIYHEVHGYTQICLEFYPVAGGGGLGLMDLPGVGPSTESISVS